MIKCFYILQTDILDKLDTYIKEDLDMAMCKNTIQALKNLGVHSYIPKTVAMDALVASKLYPVPYLISIKDYIVKKDDINYRQTCT